MTTTDYLYAPNSFVPTQTPPVNAPHDYTELSLPILHSDTGTFTLILDTEFFDQNRHIGTVPTQWDTDALRVLCPENGPNIRFFATVPNRHQVYPHVVAAQFDIVDYDAVSATRLLQSRLANWVEEFAARSGTYFVACDRRATGRHVARTPTLGTYQNPMARATYVPVASTAGVGTYGAQGKNRPTLFALLTKLGDPTITTPEQRQCIRRIVTDYLNSDISHKRLFSYLGQVVGFHTLNPIIRSLSTTPVDGLQQRQACDQLVEDYKLKEPLTDKAEPVGACATFQNVTEYRKRQMVFTPVVMDSNEQQSFSSYYTSLLFDRLSRPFRWLWPRSSGLPDRASALGERLVVLENKAFMMGGTRLSRTLSQSDSALTDNDDNDDDDDDLGTTATFQSFRVIDFDRMTAEHTSSQRFLNCPPSLVNHASHLALFASGPATLVHGGLHLSEPSTHDIDHVQLNDRLFCFDVVTKQWFNLDIQSSRRPPARHSHASALYPCNSDASSSSCCCAYAEYLIIFGGVGQRQQDTVNRADCVSDHSHSISLTPFSSFSETHCLDDEIVDSSRWLRSLVTVSRSELCALNDLWIFNFLTRQWTSVSLPLSPSPRFGTALVWATPWSLILLGGETRTVEFHELKDGTQQPKSRIFSGNPSHPPVILDDCWSLMCSKNLSETDKKSSEGVACPLNLKWEEIIPPGEAPKRAHFAAIGLTVRLYAPSEGGNVEVASCFPNQPSTGESQLAATSVSPQFSNTPKLTFAEGCVLLRVIFIISGTTQDALGCVSETPSVLIGFVSSNARNKNTGAESRTLNVTWNSVEPPVSNRRRQRSTFKARRGHTAAFFDTPEESPAEALVRHELKQYALQFRSRKARLKENDASIKSDGSSETEDAGDTRAYLIQAQRNKDTTHRECTQRKRVPCIWVTGGLRSDGKLVLKPWVLTLSFLRPAFQGFLSRASLDNRVLSNFLATGPQVLCSMAGLVTDGFESDTQSSDDTEEQLRDTEHSVRTSKSQVSQPQMVVDSLQKTSKLTPQDLKVLRPLCHDILKVLPSTASQSNLGGCFGLMTSLATWHQHSFAALSHVVENSADRQVQAKQIHVRFEQWRNTDAFIIRDDGVGLSHRNLHILLKQFGYSGENLLKQNATKFGLGFKLTAAHLGGHCLVFTRTAWALGVGLFSPALHASLPSSSFSCPIAFWATATGLPVTLPLEESEFTQNLKLIMSNSPLTSMSDLEKEFETFGSGTGTQLVFFDLQKDVVRRHFGQSSHDVSCARLASAAAAAAASDDLLPRRATLDVPLTAGLGSTSEVPDARAFPQQVFSESSCLPQRENAQAQHTKHNSALRQSFQLQDEFPLFSKAEDAPDYSLATYLYWLHLHCKPIIYFNGVPLVPKNGEPTTVESTNDLRTLDVSVAASTQDSIHLHQTSSGESPTALRCLRAAGIELPAVDRYANSLWRFLQNRLHYKLELPYLFAPQYGEDNFYGIIGFLNDPKCFEPDCTTTHNAFGDPPTPLRVCETGVLLYHKGRLINRAIHSMPAPPLCFTSASRNVSDDAFRKENVFSNFAVTAVINVPDFLIPRATKEEFVCDSDLAMHTFYDKIESIILEYFDVYQDETALAALQEKYAASFDAYREACWNERSCVDAAQKGIDGCVSTAPLSAVFDSGLVEKKQPTETDITQKVVDSETTSDDVWPSTYSSPIPRRRSIDSASVQRALPDYAAGESDAFSASHTTVKQSSAEELDRRIGAGRKLRSTLDNEDTICYKPTFLQAPADDQRRFIPENEKTFRYLDTRRRSEDDAASSSGSDVSRRRATTAYHGERTSFRKKRRRATLFSKGASLESTTEESLEGIDRNEQKKNLGDQNVSSVANALAEAQDADDSSVTNGVEEKPMKRRATLPTNFDEQHFSLRRRAGKRKQSNTSSTVSAATVDDAEEFDADFRRPIHAQRKRRLAHSTADNASAHSDANPSSVLSRASSLASSTEEKQEAQQ